MIHRLALRTRRLCRLVDGGGVENLVNCDNADNDAIFLDEQNVADDEDATVEKEIEDIMETFPSNTDGAAPSPPPLPGLDSIRVQAVLTPDPSDARVCLSSREIRAKPTLDVNRCRYPICLWGTMGGLQSTVRVGARSSSAAGVHGSWADHR